MNFGVSGGAFVSVGEYALGLGLTFTSSEEVELADELATVSLSPVRAAVVTATTISHGTGKTTLKGVRIVSMYV